MAGTSRRDAGFYWGIRFFARLYALEEIFHVVDGTVAITASAQNWVLILGYVFAVQGESAAINLQGRICATELKSATVDRGTHHSLIHDIKTRISERCLDRVRTIPLIENIFVGEHLRLTWLVSFHGPVHDINPV